MKNLLVLATPDAMVPDYGAQSAHILRFIGRKHDASAGQNGGFVVSPKPVEVPYMAEYIQELRSGALLPADKETANAAGLKFADVAAVAAADEAPETPIAPTAR